MPINMNFAKDWTDAIVAELTAEGHAVKNGTFAGTCHAYYNLQRRHINAMPRTVHMARSLQVPVGLENGFNKLKRKVEAGGDLCPHLSRSLDDIGHNDPLLNDWFIYHLHLGSVVQATGFVERTGPVLFALFQGDDAYFIGIFPHGSWTAQSSLAIVQVEWPGLLKPFTRPEVKALEVNPSDSDLASLRKNKINSFVSVGGSVVTSPGGGSTLSGMSSDVVRKCNAIRKALRSWENRVRSQYDAKATDRTLTFRLELRASGPVAIEDSLGVVVALNQ